MGHPIADAVRLEIQSLKSAETWIREGVEMTEANRDVIRNAANLRAIPLQVPKPTAVPESPVQPSHTQKGIADVPHRIP
jgi:hypothetical protein